MYLSRSNDLLDILGYLLLSAGWLTGGWLLVTGSFKLRRGERLVSGIAVGFLLFISLGNLFAHILPLTISFWLSSSLILLAGALLTLRSHLQPRLEKRDLLAMPLVLSLLLITLLFTLILKGEAIFDEYLHLPLISIMAGGDIPPHFYLNPDFYFAYHYGIHIFAASLVRMGDFFPWSAWDVSRALAIGFTLVLGWLWIRRVTRSKLAAWLGSILLTFGGGARWLLLLLPARWLEWVSQAVNLEGSGFDTAPTLAVALHRPWSMEGAGPIAFPFAFHNGIFIPAFFNLGSSGALPFMTILLLLLLVPRDRFSRSGIILWSILFSTLALSAEHFFVAIWVGIALVMAAAFLFKKRFFASFQRESFIQWSVILFTAALIALVQGGFITESARNLVAGISGSAAHSYNARGFALRWPPALLSAHLGTLSVLNPGQLIALLAELGPAIILVGVIFTRFKKWIAREDWFSSGLAASVLLSLIFPLFFMYEVDRSITRMPATALWTCLVLGFPILWMLLKHGRMLTRGFVIAGFVATVLPGLVLFRTQLYSIPYTEYTYFVDELDASYAADYWNKLPENTQVLDRVPERSVTLFGRITRANSGIYEPLPEWEALIANPDPSLVAESGYDYVYMDKTWWDSLSPAQHSGFLQPCIDFIDERRETIGVNYSLLVDVSACK